MTLEGESGGTRPNDARVIVAGSAASLRACLARWSAEAPSLEILGAILIGEGDARAIDVAHVSEAADWESLDLSSQSRRASYLVLCETPPSRPIARVILARAAASGLRVVLRDETGLRPLALDDLIGRPSADIDWTRIRELIAGKRVLITGGGGSIGGELARRVATLSPEGLCLLDSSEFNLYSMSRQLPDASIALADVRDPAAVQRWFERERPDIVFHAAALKQVPLVEAHPSEGALSNVGGCRNVAEACAIIGADMVFVSTDKAVNPSGAMGATKRVAEMYCQALDREAAKRGGPRVLSVRLGNVLGSSGSVAPVFESQIAKGGPITVTEADVRRYFMSIPQAAIFLLQAAASASHAAHGAIFVLDMGDDMPVVELARDMIRLKGLQPGVDVPITFIGLRPGEKLREELIASDEWRERDPAPGVMAVASPPVGLAEMHNVIERVVMLARAGADDAVLAELMRAARPETQEQGDSRRAASA